MSKTDKEAFAFGMLMMSLLIGGTLVVAIKEHHRNSKCAELGGIIVNLECGRFEIIEAYQP